MGPNKKMEKRATVNLFSLLFTAAIMILAVTLANGDNLAVNINRITENLDKALVDIMLGGEIHYTDIPNFNQTLNDNRFHPIGMAGLYNLTKMFIDVIFPKDWNPQDFFYYRSNHIEVNKDMQQNLKHYWMFMLVVVLILLMVPVFFLWGFCYCCCRCCCGNCGAKKKPCDKRGDLCRKIINGTLLIVLTTSLLFCVVCVFGSNQQLHTGVTNLTTSTRYNLNDTEKYLDNAKSQLTVLLDRNYKEFQQGINIIIDNSSNIVMEKLEEYSNATSMSTLANFVEKLPNVSVGLTTLKYSTKALRTYASQLNDATRQIKKDLLNTLKDCSLDECVKLRQEVNTFSTNIDFNKLPDISSDLKQFEALDMRALEKAAQEGEGQLNLVKKQINDRLQISIRNASRALDEAGVQIKRSLRNVTTTIEQIKSTIRDQSSTNLRTADKYINEYYRFVYYGGLGVGCVLLSVTMLITFGLVCGICGKRPDGYNDNCCNKGAGSKFLVCSVMLMFLTGLILAAICAVLLVAGTLIQRSVCDPIRNPNSKVFDLIPDNLSYNGIDINPRLILKKCNQNLSAYEVFNLKKKVDLEVLRTKFNITDELSNLQLDIDFSNFHILSSTSNDTLQRLGKLSVTDISKFHDELMNNNFTNIDFGELRRELNNIIGRVPDDIKTSLQLCLLHVDTYDEKILKPMKENATRVIDLVTLLGKDLEELTNVDDLLAEIKEAEATIKSQGKDVLPDLAKNFSNIVINEVDRYINRIIDQTKGNIGKCGPLSAIINGTVISTCDKILTPLNGFWFSLMWTIILFIPTILVSVKLANIYQKRKSGHYVETEYLYDAYAETIPLSSRSNKNGKKKNKKTKRHEERPQNMGGEVVAREYTQGAHPHDTRYSDMAPKHWEEFPAGGPPQYQRPPTEYERPPPYYYQGTGSSNN